MIETAESLITNLGEQPRNHRLAEPSDKLTEECRMRRIAERLLRQRQQRSDYVSSTLFAEPGWDMLLELYVIENSGSSTAASALLPHSAITKSTKARWLDHLEQLRLVRRRAHPLEPDTEFVELTNEGARELERYLSSIGDLSFCSPA
jgi:DNA-binding MarR family transcriptional regulator